MLRKIHKHVPYQLYSQLSIYVPLINAHPLYMHLLAWSQVGELVLIAHFLFTPCNDFWIPSIFKISIYMHARDF